LSDRKATFEQGGKKVTKYLVNFIKRAALFTAAKRGDFALSLHSSIRLIVEVLLSYYPPFVEMMSTFDPAGSVEAVIDALAHDVNVIATIKCVSLCVCRLGQCTRMSCHFSAPTPRRQHNNTHRNQLRTVVMGFATADVGIQLRRAVLHSSYCDADWVVALRAEFGDEHTTFDHLGRAVDPEVDKRCRLSQYLSGLSDADATLVAQIVVQQTLAVKASLWTQ
jgi:hypothetical protein